MGYSEVVDQECHYHPRLTCPGVTASIGWSHVTTRPFLVYQRQQKSAINPQLLYTSGDTETNLLLCDVDTSTKHFSAVKRGGCELMFQTVRLSLTE